MSDCSRQEEILRYWFGEGPEPEPRFMEWFRGTPEKDADIVGRFGDLLKQAEAGALDHWCATPMGRLALIILLDQFSRNAYRGKPETWANDPHVLQIALAGLDAGEVDDLHILHAGFFLMPLMHCEDPATHERSLVVFEALLKRGEGAEPNHAKGFYDSAVQHAGIVKRFGRYPHRNAILGRTSTAEELAFLEEPGSSF